jgi:dUTP pyrophosphatase
MKLRHDAQLPSRGSRDAVGYDLHLCIDGLLECEVLRHGEVLACSTGIAVAIEKGWYGRVAPRSGLGRKGVVVLGGVIDPDYRGEIKVMLTLSVPGTLALLRGERIAQLILERCDTPEVVEVTSLDETERGERGFGSTGRV